MSNQIAVMSADELRLKIDAAIGDAQPDVLAHLLTVDSMPKLDLPSLRLYDLLIDSTDDTFDNHRPALIECLRVLLADDRLPFDMMAFDELIGDQRDYVDLLAVVMELGIPEHRQHLQLHGMCTSLMFNREERLQFIVAQPFINVNRYGDVGHRGNHPGRILHFAITGIEGRFYSAASIRSFRTLLDAPNMDVNAYSFEDLLTPVWRPAPVKKISALQAADAMCVTPCRFSLRSDLVARERGQRIRRMQMLLDHDRIDIHTLEKPGEWMWKLDEFGNMQR